MFLLLVIGASAQKKTSKALKWNKNKASIKNNYYYFFFTIIRIIILLDHIKIQGINNIRKKKYTNTSMMALKKFIIIKLNKIKKISTKY